MRMITPLKEPIELKGILGSKLREYNGGYIFRPIFTTGCNRLNCWHYELLTSTVPVAGEVTVTTFVPAEFTGIYLLVSTIPKEPGTISVSIAIPAGLQR